MPIKFLKTLTTTAIVLHFIGNLWHGAAHTTLEIGLPLYKNAFIVVAILIMPLVGGALLWTKSALLGSWLAATGLLGSVLFSVYHHYVLISIDNVDHLPAGPAAAHAHFSNSAAFIALAAVAGAVLAFYTAGRLTK